MHHRLHFEPSNAPSPPTASSGLCARFMASLREHGPRGPLLTQWPTSFSHHSVHSPFSFIQKLALLLTTLHCPPQLSTSVPTASLHHTLQASVPLRFPFLQSRAREPRVPSAIAPTTAVHKKRPACLACECLRAEEPGLEMAAPLATRKHQLVEETLRSDPSFLHCYPQDSKSIRLSASEGRKNPGSPT